MASPAKPGKPNYFGIAAREKVLLERHYDFLHFRLDRFGLEAFGRYQPAVGTQNYRYRLVFSPPAKPKVYIREPLITYSDDIHMYPQDNSLCLYYPKDFTWSNRSHLHDTIIPWTHAWIVNYELYKLTGRWHHPSVTHRIGTKGVRS